MARKKEKKVRRANRAAQRTPRRAAPRRSAAGRKSVEVHFAALKELLVEGFSKLGVKFDAKADTEQPKQEEAQAADADARSEVADKPKRARRIKIVADAQPEAVTQAQSAPVPPPPTEVPVAAAPQPQWQVPAPQPMMSAPSSAQPFVTGDAFIPPPQPAAPNFNAAFNALNGDDSDHP